MELLNMVKLGTMGFKPADIKKFDASGIESEQIIELAKNGYKAEDVDELIKLATNEPAPKPEDKPDEKPDNPSETAGAKTELDDIKKQLEDAQKQIAEQAEALKKAQSKNASKDLGQPETERPEDIFRKALREVY